MLQSHCTPPTYCYSIFWGLNAIQPRDRKYALDGDFYSERIFDHDPWSKILVQGQCAFSTSRYILMKLTQTRLDKRQYAPEKILNIKIFQSPLSTQNIVSESLHTFYPLALYWWNFSPKLSKAKGRNRKYPLEISNRVYGKTN